MEKFKLKVLSYNIHKGFSLGNRRFVLKEIRDALCEIHPDIVFLQEVLGDHEGYRERIPGWPIRSQFEFLAHELWPHYTYGRNAVYSEGHHGNAILSKFPIVFAENMDVSTNEFEKRGILHGVIQVPGVPLPVHLLCVHLGLIEAERMIQISRLCARIQSHVPPLDPVIVGGDFNDWRGRASHPLAKRLQLYELFQELEGNHAKTFPSWFPALRLDRIYCRGLQARSAQCLNRPPWNGLSDHTALLGELALILPREGDSNTGWQFKGQ